MCTRAVLLICLVAGVTQAATPLQDAKRLVEDLDYAAALKLLDQVEKTEGNDQESIKEIWLLQGIAYGTLGKDAKTRDAFRKLLVVFPDTKLPGDLPPRVRTPFFEAKEWASSSGVLNPTLSVALSEGKPTSLEVSMGTDVLRLGRTVRFHVKADDREERTEDVPLVGGKAKLAVQASRADWSVEILSERRAVLVISTKRVDGIGAPVVVAATANSNSNPTAPGDQSGGQVTAPVAQTRTWARPVGIAMIAAGAVAAGVGLGFGVASSGARTSVTGAQRNDMGVVTGLTQLEASRLEAQATSQAAVANVMFVVGGALAAVGAVFVIVGPSGEPVAQLSPAGSGLLLSGSF